MGGGRGQPPPLSVWKGSTSQARALWGTESTALGASAEQTQLRGALFLCVSKGAGWWPLLTGCCWTS